VITLRYFASLRERLGVGDERVELPAGVGDLTGLTAWLQGRDAVWREALADRTLHVAVNQELVADNVRIGDGDEVAWFPPVTGG